MTDADKAREAGFYWVRQEYRIEWEIAYWTAHEWRFPGRRFTEQFPPPVIAEVDERPIKRLPQ